MLHGQREVVGLLKLSLRAKHASFEKQFQRSGTLLPINSTIPDPCVVPVASPGHSNPSPQRFHVLTALGQSKASKDAQLRLVDLSLSQSKALGPLHDWAQMAVAWSVPVLEGQVAYRLRNFWLRSRGAESNFGGVVHKDSLLGRERKFSGPQKSFFWPAVELLLSRSTIIE